MQLPEKAQVPEGCVIFLGGCFCSVVDRVASIQLHTHTHTIPTPHLLDLLPIIYCRN